MSLQPRSCCVPGCQNKTAKRHSITRKVESCQIWLQRINNPKLFQMDSEQLEKYRICDAHFERVCIDHGGKLVRRALPTLNLPGYEKGSYDHFLTSEEKMETDTFRKVRESIDVIARSSSTLTGENLYVIPPKHTYGRNMLFEENPFHGQEYTQIETETANINTSSVEIKVEDELLQDDDVILNPDPELLEESQTF